MSSSLKGYTPGLGRLLGVSAAALYERQRALVRGGLLEIEGGRGPGSGVRVTARALALLIISVLATDSLAETASRTRKVAAARPRGHERCPYTGMRTFRDAFDAALFSTGKAENIIEISVSRTAARAQIKYYDPAENHSEKTVEFATGQRVAEPEISVSATIGGSLLKQLARDVQAIVMEEVESADGHPAS
ncbi:MAG TPA: hypothetical protein VFC38_04710 [Stellaceae bacterium]|nr:hypothetical protein [Stellaceae bacterium]